MVKAITAMTHDTNIPQGYKATTLGIIPQGWEVKKIKDICDVDSTSLTPKTSAEYEFDYISLSDVKCENFEIQTSRQVFKTAPSRARRILKKGDVVISTVRPNLKGFFVVKEDVKDLIASTGFSVLTPHSCNSVYLLSYFHSQAIDKQFYSLVVGSNYPAVNSSDIANIKIAMPPVEEQRKIAEVLGVWDKAIELQAKIIDKLELRKRALMQRLLSGRQRLPGFSDPWEAVRLGNLFDERVETKCDYLPLLSITAGKGVILQTESDKKDISTDDKSKYKRICTNDIGYNTMRMWQGRSALSGIEGIVSPAYTIVIPKKSVNPAFMIALIQQPRTVYDFWTHSQGLVDDTLNCKFPNFAQVKVCVPSLSEQTAIAEVLSTADKEIEIAKAKLAAYRTQKRGLMQQLLTGKKRVKI